MSEIDFYSILEIDFNDVIRLGEVHPVHIISLFYSLKTKGKCFSLIKHSFLCKGPFFKPIIFPIQFGLLIILIKVLIFISPHCAIEKTDGFWLPKLNLRGRMAASLERRRVEASRETKGFIFSVTIVNCIIEQ